MTVTLDLPYDDTVEAARAALDATGFGILTEIDVRATMKAKLDVDIPAEVILGACRPQLAHQAISAEPSVATLLPCNVVVRAIDDQHTAVEALDPDTMMSLTGDDRLADIASEARTRLRDALARLRRGAESDVHGPGQVG